MVDWTYWHYGATNDVPPGREHVTIMDKPARDGTGNNVKLTHHMMSFHGTSREHVQSKIDAFWEEEKSKAANKAAGRVKAAESRAGG